MGRKRGSAFCIIKYVFFIFNVLIWLLGCSVLAVGVWMQVNKGPYMAVLPSHSFFSATAICITAGAIILVVGFCGCCGALIENKTMLIVYFVFVLVIFGLEVALTALGFSNKEKIKNTAKQELLYSIEYTCSEEADKEYQEGVVAMIDTIQEDLECCGMNNFSDWHTICPSTKVVGLPSTCCIAQESSCGTSSDHRFYKRGCLKEIEYWFVQNMYVLGIVGLTVAVVQVLAMIAAVMLFCCLRSDSYLL